VRLLIQVLTLGSIRHPSCDRVGNSLMSAVGAEVIRKAFVMAVNAGSEEEYERRHNRIWPELEESLRTHGVSNYTIFLQEATRQLFAYVEIESEAQWEAIANTPECRRWWQHMADLMPHNADNSPLATDLREVFHLT
jgi:L-rhamnose mutarotase